MSRQLGGESRVYVHDDDGEVHYFNPGDDVPTWAEKKITNPDAWATADGDGDDGEGEGSTASYSSWLKADLEAEVDKRNEGRDDNDLIEVEAPGNKAELIAALEADDSDA